MKKYIIQLLLIILRLEAMAVPCSNQSTGRFGETIPDAGPDGNLDYFIVLVMVIITLYVLIATIKCFVKPGEKHDEHIKRMILNDMQP
jgi:hypothetical protein